MRSPAQRVSLQQIWRREQLAHPPLTMQVQATMAAILQQHWRRRQLLRINLLLPRHSEKDAMVEAAMTAIDAVLAMADCVTALAGCNCCCNKIHGRWRRRLACCCRQTLRAWQCTGRWLWLQSERLQSGSGASLACGQPCCALFCACSLCVLSRAASVQRDF